ncbi:hypothetical protein CAC42_6874 [Sphaceloma murrayae]|uniref:Mtf2-like C-terminal domain-containing protein n=1 Tax=Sphaceloma murrayae TaxID=2082308 RepID=A0A2K1QHF5_9PEZI|nr:hypothetical protein CAC42_6874 [Sphaceloma murrayae]
MRSLARRSVAASWPCRRSPLQGVTGRHFSESRGGRRESINASTGQRGRPLDFRGSKAEEDAVVNIRFGSRRPSQQSSGGNVPFEGLDVSGHQEETSTLTRREKLALFKLRQIPVAQKSTSQPTPVAPIANPAQPIPPPKPTSILDRLLDDVKAAEKNTGIAPSKLEKTIPRTPHGPGIHKFVAQVKSQRGNSRKQRDEQHRQILEKIERCQTDHDVYKVLQDEIFKPFADMHLDDSTDTMPIAIPSGSQSDQTAREHPTMRTFGDQFAIQLQTAARVLRKRFPTSGVVLTIIPQLHKFGPTAFALGSSTELYNCALEQVAIQDEDFVGTLDLLQEMEREVIDPDQETLDILSRHRQFAKAIRKSTYGQATQVVMATDRNFSTLRDIKARMRDFQPQVLAKQEVAKVVAAEAGPAREEDAAKETDAAVTV